MEDKKKIEQEFSGNHLVLNVLVEQKFLEKLRCPRKPTFFFRLEDVEVNNIGKSNSAIFHF